MMAGSSFSRLEHLYPWGVGITIFLALLLAIGGVLIYLKATQTDEDSLEQKIAPFLETCTDFLSRFGLFPSNPLNRSFENALNLMRNFIGGTHYRYRLPWILMFGGTDAGKSTLLHSLALDHPIERSQDEETAYEKPLCDWCFYDHGIILDLDGKLVIHGDRVGAEDSQWSLFLNLLAHYRPRRALDGIVLTIPVSEIAGKTALSHDDLMLRANYLYDKLWQMQRVTSLRIPVYVVITKCDLLPGYESFCKALPTYAKDNMFGWSNDKAIDSIYTADWIDEVFASLNVSLTRLQEEIYAEEGTPEKRDGIFLFPLAFSQLKGGLRTYANHLFKPSSYHESFFLRGIYFVGDSHSEDLQPETSSSLEFPWHFSQKVEQEKRSIYFIKDLFEKKIFREVGLARPVSRILLGNTTAIRFAKGFIALLAIGGTLALLRANEHLRGAHGNLMAVLPKIDVTLEKIRGQDDGTDIGRLYFDQQAQTLLDAMTQINVTTVFCPFLPPSWFSRLDAKIRQVMILVYDKVVLRSMGSQLRYKASQVTSLNTLVPLSAADPSVDPLKTPEFRRLQDFVKDIQALENAANTYNSLGEKSNLQDVSGIIKYLFNYEMPPSFFTNGYYYLSALKQAKIQPFNFQLYEGNATAKLNKLFDEFQRAVFDPNKIVPGLSTLTTALYQFSGIRNYSSYDTSVLRDVFLGLDETLNSIENPGFQWIDADQFQPGQSFDTLMPLIAESNFFPPEIAASIVSSLNQNFIKFRKRLADYASPLFENETLFMTESGLAVAAPTQGALTLASNLKAFFSETFMAPSQNKSIITSLPVGSILLWDTLRLQQANELITTYNEFIDARLLTLPKALQPFLQRVAQESLTKNLVDLIANSEVFSARTLSGKGSPEDDLLSQVQNYRVAAPYLEQILFTLKENNANAAFSTLKALLIAQVYVPLQKLDSILTDEAPYALKDDSFDWWVGKDMAGLEAFGTPNLTELKSYLSLQRDRINYLAQEFAKPLASFLERVSQDGMPGDLPLVAKWQGIVAALNEYTHKAPGNSLVDLENFIITPLNEVTLQTCEKYTHTTDLLAGNHDFFLNILADMESKLQKRCTVLAGEIALCTYKELSDFFNTHLSGKFPFIKGKDPQSPDADPEDIRIFFQLMDGQDKGIKETLSQATDLGPAGQNALTFIEQMEKVRTFLGGFLAPRNPLPAPAFVFDAEFRVNRGQECHGNEVLDWQIISHDTLVSIRSPSRKGYWNLGDSVKVIFRWAANSPLQPFNEGVQSNFEIQGANAIYSYTGMWALLRLLQQHQDVPCKFTAHEENSGKLRFEIPLYHVPGVTKKQEECHPKAKVFLKITLSPVVAAVKPDSIPKGDTSECVTGEALKVKMQEKLPMGKAMEVPQFPCHAPELKSGGNRYEF